MPPVRSGRMPVPLLAGLGVTGIAVTFAISSLAGSNSGEAPVGYQPFLVGTAEERREDIAEGPVCVSDPIGGDRSFCLDLEGEEFVALHLVPPGEKFTCLVQWNRKERLYEDCNGIAVDTGKLRRFPVSIRENGDDKLVYVDLRTVLPAPDGTGR